MHRVEERRKAVLSKHVDTAAHCNRFLKTAQQNYVYLLQSKVAVTEILSYCKIRYFLRNFCAGRDSNQHPLPPKQDATPLHHHRCKAFSSTVFHQLAHPGIKVRVLIGRYNEDHVALRQNSANGVTGKQAGKGSSILN